MEDRDPDRLFTARQRRVLFLRANGCCEDCGVILAEGWHAHHVTPHASGGDTLLENGRALCPACHVAVHGREAMTAHNPNPDLGNQPPIIGRDYSWQERSLELFQVNIADHYSETPGGFNKAWIDQVTPSGGKTVASIKKAAWLIDQDLIDFAVWVVPRNSIKTGFEDDCKMVELANTAKHRLGDRHLRIDTELTPDRARIPRNHHGAVITYQALGSFFDLFDMWRRANVRLAFIFDEIHHGADDAGAAYRNQWGSDSLRVVGLANCVIALTGTPLRSDSKKVAFLEYGEAVVETDSGLESGFRVIPSFAFTYADGMAAGIARKLIFEHFDPYVIYEREDAKTGEILESGETRLSALGKADAARLKRKPFERNKGDLPEQMLRRAYDANQMMRKNGDPDAAILVICADNRSGDTIDHAAELITKICGETPVWVTSDEPDSRERIKRFKKSKDRWIIAKQMISEGTNLPRVRVIVMLSTPTQHVYWTQLIHRATRNEDEERLQDALVLQLDIQPVKKWAEEVEQEVLAGVANIPEPKGPGGGEGDGPRDILHVIAANLDERSVMLEGDDYTRYDPPATKILEMSSAADRLQRHTVFKVLRIGEEAGEIKIEKSAPATGSVFTVEEQARRYWDEGMAALKQAVVIANQNGERMELGVVINQCKRIAGMGKLKIADLIASHSDPLKVTQAFYDAARRYLAEVKKRRTG